MLRTALTGGIGTGKSYCLRRFVELGAVAIDADLLARDAVAPGSAGLRAVVERFGAAVLAADGTLDRRALGAMVFADTSARAALEAIIHPEVYRRIREWYASLPASTAVAIADVPLLFESRRQHDFDAVIVAACPPEEQVRRVMARDHLDEPSARARVAAQWPIADKVARATYVIWTDRSFEETDRQIADVHAQLLRLDR